MPQLPVIIPLIIIGISFGSLLKSEKPKISWRRVVMLSLVAGLLNAVNAYAVYLLTPQPTFGGATFARASATTDISFTVASFLAGFIIVAAVFVIARVVSRRHQGEAPELGEESESELNSEELSKLKSG
jgi:lysylphosphatidylglycerol synthetase-like protein (DUF2156 family)